MSNSLEDISSICFKEKRDTSDTDHESDEKSESCSLPTLPLSLQNQLDSPEKMFRKDQAMTMKEIDCKLNALRRENFDLKLRLYLERQNKGIIKPEGEALISKEFEKREKALRACKKSLREKDDKIRDLEAELNESEKNKNFEIGLLRNENEALVCNLSVASALCKSFMNHLCEIKEFWSQFLNVSSNHQNKNLINSFTQWFNTSQDLLNNASIIITDDNNVSTAAINELSSKFKGMSSLGLLSDISEFIPNKETNKERQLNLTFHIKLDQSVQTDITNDTFNKMVNHYQKVEKLEVKDTLTQTVSQVKRRKKMAEKASQTVPAESCEQKTQTELIMKDVWVQPNFSNQDTPTQTQFKEMTEIGIQSVLPALNVIGASPVLKPKNGAKGYKSAILKKLSNAHLLQNEPIKEGEEEDENHFKLPNDKMFAKARKTNRSNIPDQDQKENQLELSLKEANESLSSKSSFEFGRKNHLVNKLTNKMNKMINLKEKKLDKIIEGKEIVSSSDLGIGDSEPDINSPLHAYIKLSYYQMLHKNLNSISSNLHSLDNLTNDRFVLQMINDKEFLSKFKPFLATLHQTMSSSKTIFRQFSIEDEGSILAQLQKIKAKKDSMEKAITRQLRKTDKLLKKAETNLKD